MELQNFNKILEAIKSCEVKELSKNFDEFDYKLESARDNSLNTSLLNLKDKLYKYQVKNKYINNIISAIYKLYVELQTKGPWNSVTAPVFAKNIQKVTQEVYHIDIEKVLCKESVCDKQFIFDECIQNIHKKLSQENYKKNPSIIEEYCLLTNNIKDYDIKINPMTTLPASLILIQDHIVEMKIKGLICCRNIFKCLSSSDFSGGNYYDVFLEALYRQLSLKDVKLTNLVLESLLEVIRIVPEELKKNKCDVFLMHILNEIFITSDFENKKLLFLGLIKLISIHQINCAKRKKKLFMIVQENLDLCVDLAARSIILDEVAETLMIWLKYCWCLWKYSEDKKILSTLFKLLYAVSNEETDLINKMNSLISLLFKLSLQDEQINILSELDLACNNIEETIYLSRLKNVQKLCKI